MVEQVAVNHLVIGSSPILGAKLYGGVRLMVKTAGCDSANMGYIPIRHPKIKGRW